MGRRNNGGNNGGNGGGNGGGNPNALRRRARRDIRTSQQDYLNTLRNQLQGVDNDYAGLQNTLMGMAGNYRDQTAGIGDQMNADIAGLRAALGGDTGVALPEIQAMLPVAEQQAGLNLGTTYGAGAHELLANQASRNAAYVQSGRREGEYARVSAKGNIRQSIMDLMQQRPQLIRQRLDELREQALERKLAKSRMESEEATARYIESLIGDILKDNKGRGNGRNNDNQGGGGNNWGGTMGPGRS